MNYCFVQFHEREKSLIFYDGQKKKIDEVVVLPTAHYFIKAVERMRRQSDIKKIVICYGVRRFSLVRLSALFGNILADAKQVSVASLLVPEDADAQEIVRIFQTTKVIWRRTVEPVYIFEPHITQRKKK